ncbi:aspartyl/asparaginyl beta-hydroxylase domain-containing protein [Sphingomonas sp. ac-8]|uniref:aspartyl/asparaginyl beta-hydroxylase domain-containing protein n=1 Tax=Sphingomonas sp. ac-8 TaxID=3242977 RepID=UPI003A805BC7
MRPTAIRRRGTMPEAQHALVVRAGKRLRRWFDPLIRASSLVSTAPVLDVRAFPWTRALRDQWQAIRDEAMRVAVPEGAAPPLAAIAPDPCTLAAVDRWRSFVLCGYGYDIDDNLARCPETAAALRGVPGLTNAMFSILAPGSHIPAHRGVTKGLITCHLALVVPRDGDVRMRLGNRMLRWAEGETLVFDDTYAHEVWNDTGGTRVVLLLQFKRPLRQPGRWLADLLLDLVRRSAFVQEARRNLLAWHRTASSGGSFRPSA